ncbi:hypothetical protein T4E_5937 [Trichinella pseudospiralis]|uniref:Uncharacterized protein n=1 Tax=Trichinella pseudospiralis TaxID=6337 RepID=A0A0V0XZ80_TRIPS|nr:hypothetical protein T4E_5937 [Trichinella pseudospiralis]
MNDRVNSSNQSRLNASRILGEKFQKANLVIGALKNTHPCTNSLKELAVENRKRRIFFNRCRFAEHNISLKSNISYRPMQRYATPLGGGQGQ